MRSFLFVHIIASLFSSSFRLVDGELRVPVYGCGRLPSPVSMLPLCESPPPLMMTPEEAEELERVKIHGPPEPHPCQPIPQGEKLSSSFSPLSGNERF